MGSLYNDNFKHVSRAALIGSGAQGYFKVQGYPGYPVIITRFEYSASEKLQIVEAFKEYIHLYAYGRAASQVQIQGHCLNIGDDFSGSVPSLKEIYQSQLRAFKVAQSGGLISIVGPVGVLKGVAVNMSFGIAAGQDGVFNFSMGFVVLDGTNESSVGQAQGTGGTSSQSDAATNTPPASSSSGQASAENQAASNPGGNAQSGTGGTLYGEGGTAYTGSTPAEFTAANSGTAISVQGNATAFTTTQGG